MLVMLLSRATYSLYVCTAVMERCFANETSKTLQLHVCNMSLNVTLSVRHPE